MTTAMLTRTRVDLAQQMLDAFNSGDWPTCKALMTPDSVQFEPGMPELRGPDAIVDAVNAFRIAMPDLTGTVTRAFESGDEAVTEIVWRGTHTGPLATPNGPIAATGRPVTIHACFVFAFEGDKIAYGRHYWDLLELLGAIGAVPAPAGT